MTDAVKEAFQRDLLQRIEIAEESTGHHFGDLRKMIGDLGGFGTAKRLMSPGSEGTLSYGFKLLAKANLLNLSVEQVVIDYQDRGIFEEAEVSRARSKIAMARVLFAL